MKTHSNIDFKEMAEHYATQIEGWHLFYESFIEYEYVLSVSNGVLFEMRSEIAKAKRSGNRSAENAEKRVNMLNDCISKMHGMNNRCMMLHKKLKQSVAKQLDLEKENQELKNEIEAIKKSFNEQA